MISLLPFAHPRRRDLALVAMVASASFAACSDSSAANSKVDAGPPGDAAPTGNHRTGQTLMVDSSARTYDVTVPATCDASHLVPLVFVYHGDGGKGSDMYGAPFPIEAAAAAAGGEAIFVYPDGTNDNENGSAWNIYDDPGVFPYAAVAPTGNDDVDFFDAMVATFEATGCVDPHRVFITGFSNGGYMANQLARWRSKVISATAPQSGGPPAGSATPSNDYAAPNYCVGTTDPVPALIIHGETDGTVAFENAQQAASYWDMANVCADNALDCSASTNSLLEPPATPTTATTPSPCVTSTGCKKNAPVILCAIPELGHAIWAQAPGAIWAFFAARG
jgi:polyhydroxybutyrate depolymerase